MPYFDQLINFKLLVFGDTLLIVHNQVKEYTHLFNAPASVVVASQEERGGIRQVVMDKYVLEGTPVVFNAKNPSALAEFLGAAAVALTQKTHEALVTTDGQTYRLVKPGILYLFLQALAQKAKELSEFSHAA